MMRIGMSAAALMLLAPLVGTVQAQGPITIAVGTTTAVQVTPGSQFSVPLLVDMSQAAGGNLASLTTGLTWGANRITLDSIVPGGFGSLTANTTNAAAGNALLSMFNTTGTTATVTFATAYFTAGTVGGTQLLLNLSAAGDQLGTSILAELQARSLGVCVAMTGLWGDVNADGVVNILDAQQIARYSVGLSVANLVAVQTLGDVNADSSVNIIDAQQIARFSVALSAAARVNTARFLPPTVAALTVSPNPDTVVVGGTGQLLAAPTDSVGNALTGCAPVAWSSSDTTKATVSSSGVVSGRALGTVTITASANGHTASTTVVTFVPPFQQLVAGGFQTCGLTSAGATYCWGRNEWGQLGNGSAGDSSSVPVAVAGGLTFTALTAGFGQTCALTSGGAAYCWGGNYSGQLGNNSTTNSSVPVAVEGGLMFKALTAGNDETCGLTSAGVAYCWGANGYGELGNNDTTASPVPVAVAGGLTFAALHSGGDQTCGLTSAGAAYCWGYNYDGELGNNDTTSSSVPAAVVGGLTFTALSAGANQTCGLTSAGAAYCWGYNADGELGNNSTTDSSVPVAVTGGLTFMALSAGGSCGLTSVGTAYCWGYNGDGELGNNSLTSSSVPVAVAGGLTFTALNAGHAFHTCGLTSAGTAYCWGYNAFGELGNNTTTNSSVPVPVVSH